jgi:hypothetical protein
LLALCESKISELADLGSCKGGSYLEKAHVVANLLDVDEAAEVPLSCENEKMSMGRLKN